MNPEAAQNEFHSSNSKISLKQPFAIAAFRNWTELFQHVQTTHAGILDVQPRGLIGLQHLWPPERRFDIDQLDELGTVGRLYAAQPCSSSLLLGRSGSTTYFESGRGRRLQLDRHSRALGRSS